jgi:hypothetical protein
MEQTLGFIVFIAILALVNHFQPWVDRLDSGDWVLWYNEDRKSGVRKYKVLWRK